MNFVFYIDRISYYQSTSEYKMLKNIQISNYSRISKDASPQLDSLRGLSALIVLFAHANQILVAPTTMSFFGIGGLLAQGAVMVFFVLSGFLIGKSLTRNIHQNSQLDIRTYLIDRFNRIYPPFLYSLIIVGILYALAPFLFNTHSLAYMPTEQYLARQSFEITPSSVFSSLFFLNGFIGETISVNGPLWSLSYEVWYYIIAALMLKSSKPGYAIATALLVIILGFLNTDFIVHSVIWFLGLLLCILHNNNIFNQKLNKLFYFFGFTGTLIFSYLFLATQYNLPTVNLTFLNNSSLILYKLSLGLLTTCFIYSLLRGTKKFTTLFKGASSYSYTLYIIHFPILLFIFGITQLNIQGNLVLTSLVYIFSCALILIISKLSARKVENMKLLK